MSEGREFNAVNLVESLAREFAAVAREKGLQISGFVTPEAPELFAIDEQLVRLALSQMLRHSIEKTHNGAVLVEVVEDPHDSQHVKFSVSDSRTDITEQELKNEIALLSATPVNGTTLGAILESINSRLKYDKMLLGRSTRVYFPIPKSAARWDAPKIPVSPQVQKATFFLVANDPPPNRIIQQYMRFYGLNISGAPTAAESLSVLGKVGNERPFDVIGIAPPIEDMDPFELARAIKSANIDGSKLLYVAPFDDPQDRLRAMETGFDLTVSKPLSKSDLFGALEQLVGRIAGDDCEQERQLILIAEDNPVNQKLALFQVRSLGFEGILASNGREAVKAAAQMSLVAILMDINMPEMDGIEATKAIRAGNGASKNVPIIGLTAYPGFRGEALESGMDYFLEKPAKKAAIVEALQACGVTAATQSGARKGN